MVVENVQAQNDRDKPQGVFDYLCRVLASEKAEREPPAPEAAASFSFSA